MTVGSLLLILVAVALLVAGVLGGSNVLIVCSIVATVTAAIVLIIAVWQSEPGTDPGGDDDDADADEVASPVDDAHRSRGPGYRSTVRDTAQASRVAASHMKTSREAAASGEAASEPNQVLVEGPAGPGMIPGQGPGARRDRFEADVDEDPPDEPSAQAVSPSNAARVALLATDVLVVDGRPRYHMSGCGHLLGRISEPLPVGEAVELGFTPCGLCEPDSALLAAARRV